MNTTSSNSGALEPLLGPPLAPIVEHWSHSMVPNRTSLSLQCSREGAKVKIPLLIKWGCIYNQRGWCFTSLVTPSAPSWLFDFLWLFYFTWLFTFSMCPLDFHFTVHFKFWVRIYMIHNNNVAYDNRQLMTWHDITLLIWHGLLDDMAMSSQCCCSLVYVFLRMHLLSNSLWLRDKEFSMI